MIVYWGGITLWPEIVDLLAEELDSNQAMIVEHASFAVSIIIEDSSSIFEGPKYNSTLSKLLPILGNLLTCENKWVLSNVISTLNILITTSNELISAHLENYLEAILNL